MGNVRTNRIVLDILVCESSQCVDCKEPILRGQILGLRKCDTGAVSFSVCVACALVDMNARAEALQQCGYDVEQFRANAQTIQ